jgi:hypothetical protein
MLVEASKGLTVAAVGFVAAEALLPSVTLIAVGHATGEIPAAVRGGLGSAAGHRLEVALLGVRRPLRQLVMSRVYLFRRAT